MKNCLAILASLVLTMTGAMPAQAMGQDWKLLFSLQAEPGAVGPLSRPSGLFIDSQSERYYVIDSGRNRLVSFDRGGKLLLAFNAGGALDRPVAMVKRADGRLLVLEKGKASLTEIDLKTREVVPHRLDEGGQAIYPQRLKVGEQGLYVLDKASGAIVALDQGLKTTGRFDCPDCQAGYADFALKGSSVYALPMLGTEIHLFASAGAIATKIALQPPPEFPISLALVPDGGFLVLERHAGTVARYQADGRLVSRFLGPGHKEGSLSYPIEVQVDPWGRVCVVDEGNGRVGVFQP